MFKNNKKKKIDSLISIYSFIKFKELKNDQ